MTMKIYHNPRCSKSREALEILQEKGVEVDVVKYLEETPSAEALRDLLKKLGMKAEEIVRKGEKDYKENFKGKSLTDEEWIQADRKSTRLNSSHVRISYAVFCLKKKITK